MKINFGAQFFFILPTVYVAAGRGTKENGHGYIIQHSAAAAEDWRRKWVIATKPGDGEGRTATALNEEAFPGIIGSHFVMFVHLPWPRPSWPLS